MTQNKTTISQKTLAVAGIFAALVIAFLATTPAAYASGYNPYGSNYGGNGWSNNGGNYGYGSYQGYTPSYHDYYHYQAPVYIYPRYNYNTNIPPTTTYTYSTAGSPTYNYYQPPTVIDYQPAPTYYENYQYPVNYVAPTTYYESAPTVTYQTYQTPTTYYVPSQPTVTQSTSSGLSISCSADPGIADVNQPVTWTASVTGGIAPYTYSWSGSGNISGNQSSATTYYATPGNENAIVSVTSADGETAESACGSGVAIRGATPTYYVPPTTSGPSTTAGPATSQAPNDTPLSASAGSAFGSIPWGFLAILIILFLFGMIIYLLANRRKM